MLDFIYNVNKYVVKYLKYHLKKNKCNKNKTLILMVQYKLQYLIL